MSKEYKFQPTKFKRINFSLEWSHGIGLGFYISTSIIAIEIPFMIFEIMYLSKQEVEEHQRIAEFFAKNADLLHKDEE